MRQAMIKWNRPGMAQQSRIKLKLAELEKTLKRSMEVLQVRGEALESILQKSDDIKQAADEFNEGASAVACMQLRRKWKWTVMIVAVVLIALAVLLSMLGVFDHTTVGKNGEIEADTKHTQIVTLGVFLAIATFVSLGLVCGHSAGVRSHHVRAHAVNLHAAARGHATRLVGHFTSGGDGDEGKGAESEFEKAQGSFRENPLGPLGSTKNRDEAAV
jgi:hypothetical protein